MAFKMRTPLAGSQRIATNSTTKKHPLGTVVQADDPDYGSGEFIYLKGVASTVVGSWVLYNPDAWTSTLLTGDDVGPVAVAMSACVANEFGWYQIHGKANAVSADVADNGRVFIDTADGKCDDAFVSGDLVHGARWASADDTATGRADVEIARPFVNDGNDNDTA